MEPVFYQEGGSVSFEPAFDAAESEEFLFITGGSLPATLVSSSARPNAYLVTRRKHWDPTLFLIHEAVAVPLWFAIGMLLDAGRLSIRNLMLAFLGLRIGLAALLWLRNVAEIGWRLEVIAWMAFLVYLVAIAVRGGVSFLRKATGWT